MNISYGTLEKIYLERYDDAYNKLKELIKEGIVKENDQEKAWSISEESVNTINNLINTEGLKQIKTFAITTSDYLYDYFMSKYKHGILTEQECINEGLEQTTFSNDHHMIRINEIKNSNLESLTKNYFPIYLYYSHFILKKHLSPREIWDRIELTNFSEGSFYRESYSRYLLFNKYKARLSEIENKESSNGPMEEIENIDINEITGYKNKVAILDKLGVIKSINENLEIQNPTRVFNVLVGLGIFEKNKKTTIVKELTKLRDGDFYNPTLEERVNNQCFTLNLAPLCKK